MFYGIAAIGDNFSIGCIFLIKGRLPMQISGLDLKQEIMRINNNVNITMFGTGLRKQRVSVIEDKIIISADHKRIPALAALDGKDRMTTRFIDVAILDEYKCRLKKELAEQINLTVKSVMKDYDPEHELAVTVIVLAEPICADHYKNL
jgi:hypothetical protein